MHESSRSGGPLTWEVVQACPMCGSGLEEHVPFESYADGDLELHYFLCKSCGLVFQSPRPNSASLDLFYEAEYRRRIQGNEGPSDKDRRIQAGRARNLLAILNRQIPDPRFVLDVGCSAGEFLVAAQRAFGSRVAGIEPGEAYRLYTQQRGLDVFEGLSALPGEMAKAIDLVSVLHVLEHLSDPVQTLIDLRERWLGEAGYLLVEVPNLYGHQSYELAHLTAFSPGALGSLLGRAGYRVLLEQIHGQPRSNLLPLYLTFLAQASPAEPIEAVAVREERIRCRRRAGMWRMRWLSRFLPRLTWKRLPELVSEQDG